eukprot:c10979_g2_i1 orf=3-197(-)
MYAARNEARVSFLKKELENVRMHEGEVMSQHVNKIQDLREQLINVDEVMTDAQIVSRTMDSLPPS